MKKIALTLLIVFHMGLLSAQNNCLEFSGADDYVSIGSNFGLGATTKSVECWVYLSSTSGRALLWVLEMKEMAQVLVWEAAILTTPETN